MPFEELEHTADVLMRVTAQTPEELFEESARAMFQILFCSAEDRGVAHAFSLEADSPDTLLHDYLSELLFISEVEGFAFCCVEIELKGTKLSAVAHGERFDRDKHAGGTEIKGISYSGLSIIKENDHYHVDILFDV